MDTGPPAAWQGPDLLQQVDINRNLSWSFYRPPTCLSRIAPSLRAAAPLRDLRINSAALKP